MKKLIPLAAFLLLSYFASAQAVQDWTSGLPTLATYNNHTIATDSQGNVYSVGTYDGVSRDFDSGTGVFNMSSFSNFLRLRHSDKAQKEISDIAGLMLDAVKNIDNNPFEHSLNAFGY